MGRSAAAGRVALAFDALNRQVEFGLLSTGPLDEVAHLATAALGLMVVACFVDAPRRFYVAALVASVAIDLELLKGASVQPFLRVSWVSALTLAVCAAPAVACAAPAPRRGRMTAVAHKAPLAISRSRFTSPHFHGVARA